MKNKKLLNLIGICSGITTTVAVGMGGIVYSLQENSGDKPIDQNNILPIEVYRIENNVLMGFTDEFLADTSKYSQYNTMEIPASVTSINESAFCPNNNTTIPDFINKLTFAENSSCLKINRRAFTRAISLKSVSLPEKITMLGGYTFYDCSSLTSVDLSNCTNLSIISSNAFSRANLTSADLSKCINLSSINMYAFSYNSRLTSVKFPTSLTQIGWCAFSHSGLNSVDLSRCTNLSSIDIYAFGNCHELTSITFPSSLTSINSSAFLDTSNLSSITWNAWQGGTTLGSNSFSGVCPTGGTVTVTNPKDDQHNSSALLQYLFNGGLPAPWWNSSILPNSVFDIEQSSGILKGFKSGINISLFDGICNTMQIPASVTSVANNAFDNNKVPSFIHSLTFADGSVCSSINQSAFLNSSSFTSVDLSKCTNLSVINENAFYGCTGLTSISFSSGLRTIDNNAFSGCTSIPSVDLSRCTNLSVINANAFSGCTGLTSVSFPSSLTTINVSAFGGCASIPSVDLSRCTNLSLINYSAFDHCSSLTSVSFPSSLTTIQSNVFDGCSNLSSITWNAWQGTTSLDSSLFSDVCPTGGTVTVTDPIDDQHDSDQLLSYLLTNGGLPQTWAVGPNLPYSVYDIDETTGVLNGFKSGIDLSQYDGICDTMQIPASVTSIGDNAFNNKIPSFIKNLTFADGSICSAINSIAFNNCSSLTSVDLFNCTNLSVISNVVFNTCTSLTSVNFPSSLQEVGSRAFFGCSNLSSITWNAWQGGTSFYDSFEEVSPITGGTVTVINPIDAQHDSNALLQYLLNNADLPSVWNRKILPEEVYTIENDVLKGFTDAFLANPSAYSQYNTMEIPASVTSIANSAFNNKIPSFIKNLTFENGSNCSAIEGDAFTYNSSITSLKIPASVNDIMFYCFYNCSSLKYIAWELPDDYENIPTLDLNVFDDISSTGTVRSLNTSVASSQDLLDWLKAGNNIFDNWTIAR